MKWERGYQSRDVDDLRGRSVRGGGGGAGLAMLLPFIFRRFGIMGLIVVGIGYFVLRSCDQGALLGGFDGSGESVQQTSPAEDELAQFTGFVFDDAQRTWTEIFAAQGQQYEKARLTLFTDRVDSACGRAGAAVGPFYCPGDHRVYIDLSFYQTLRDRLGAGGDFAQAYVIAHEVGHHVQNLLGALERGGDAGANGGQVRVELQADCFAGVWAHSTQRRALLEAGDIEEAMIAARSIGDDTLQREATGTVQPHKWTHGSSEQRKRWFQRGLQQGTLAACDTFSAREL